MMSIHMLHAIHRADIWILQFCNGTCLVQQLLPGPFVIYQRACNKLQCDLTLEYKIFGEIDLTHSSFTEKSNDLVVAKRALRQQTRQTRPKHSHSKTESWLFDETVFNFK